MYVEKREFKGKTKYYLVYSFRENDEVKKIRKYLGYDLSSVDLEKKVEIVKKEILSVLQDKLVDLFDFKLTNKQVEQLNKYDVDVVHFHKDEWKRFTEEFVYNTNAIEGSTVQRDDVPFILEQPKVHNADELEAKGVAKAIDFIRKTKEALSVNFIKKLHKLCFEKTKSFAGKIRSVEVVIKNSRGDVLHQGVKVVNLKSALNDLVDWYAGNKKRFNPLVLAALVHNQFEYIHPFQDGNGRVGRLLLNYVLIKNKHPPININLEDRSEYYSALKHYDLSHDVKPMLELLIKQYKSTLKKVTTKR